MPNYEPEDIRYPTIRDADGFYVIDPAQYGAGGAALDAFSRRRVSGTGQRFDVEFTDGTKIDDELMVDVPLNGATVVHNSASRDCTLAVNGAVGNESIRFVQHWHNPYTPGNSQLIELTGTMDASELGGGTASVFIKNGIDSSETEYLQSVWSENTLLDSDGVSVVNWDTSQIFFMDFQSLKVGTIRFGLVRNGEIVIVHKEHNDNQNLGGYWQYPNLPIQWRLYNDGTYTISEIGYWDENNGIGFRYKIAQDATATMRAICGTVKSEGGQDLFDLAGLARSVSRGVTKLTSVGTTELPILSIRPKSTFNSMTNYALAIPETFIIETNNPVHLKVTVSPDLTGAVWNDVDTTRSMMEYDMTATAIANGLVVAEDYIGAGVKNVTSKDEGILGRTVLSYCLAQHAHILTLSAVKTDATDAEVLASIKWREIR